MPCTPVLTHVAKEQCPTKPGLKTVVKLAFADDLTAIGAATDHAVATITATSPKGFYSINASRKEADIKSVPNEDGGYTTTVVYFVNKQEAAKAKIFNSINAVEAFVALVEDQNGAVQIVGAKDHPAKAMVETSVTPRNGYKFTLTWEEHGDLPFFFTGTAPAAT
jgi:hypothetical protein